MINLLIGIFIGIVLAETGCLPILQDYFSELFNSFNKLKEEL